MKFIRAILVTQAGRAVVVGAAALASSCSSRQVVPSLAPSDPEAAVRAFMSAVRVNDLSTMGALWGTSDGPAAEDMDPTELRQRLTVMQRYLVHESYEVLPAEDLAFMRRGPERRFNVRLSRNNCTPVVPFTVVPFGERWLVQGIDLAEAGNPARVCAP